MRSNRPRPSTSNELPEGFDHMMYGEVLAQIMSFKQGTALNTA